MSSEPGGDKKVLSLPPPRSYAVPGGPLARDLGSADVYVLSEFARGGSDDKAR